MFKKIISFLLIFTINFIHLATPALVLAEELTVSNTSETSTTSDSTQTTTNEVNVTPAPSSTPVPSEEPTPTPIESGPTPTASSTPIPSETPSPSPITIDPISTATPSATPISTPAPAITSDPTATPSATPIASDSGKIGAPKHPQSNARLQTKSERLDKSKEVIVKFKKERINLDNFIGKTKAYFFEKSHNIETVAEIKDLNLKLVSSDKEPAQLIEELKHDPSVERVEPNQRREKDSIPSDSDFPKLWGLNNTGQTVNGYSGTADADIDAPEAWDLESSSQQDIVVAVIDTGVYYDHPDLKNNMWDGSNCKDENNNPISGGCPKHGWDYYFNDNDPDDEDSHGTHVSGTIAGVADNSGIVGISRQNNIKIMALKVAGPGGYGFFDFDLIRSVNFARHNGAKVINASFGSGDYSQSLKDAIDAFPGLFVASAGNLSRDNDLYPKYPAGYDSPNIIAVTATDQSDELAGFSSYGRTTVDVGAPGVNIYSTVNYGAAIPNEVFSENFDSVTPPALPGNFTKTGDFGTVLDSQTEGGGGSPFETNVLTGDTTFAPYKDNANSILTSNTKYDLSTTEGAGASFYFDAKCDSEYNVDYWFDYMVLEGSNDGVKYQEIYKWDEATLDNLNGNTDPTGFAAASIAVAVPDDLRSSQFSYRLRWVTDNSVSGGGKGCFVDNLSLTKYLPNKNGYDYYNGTSMSSPHTAGTAASVFSYNTSLTSSQVKNIVMDSGDPIPALNGKTVSGKRINLYNALVAAVQTPNPSPTPTPTPQPVNNNTSYDLGILVLKYFPLTSDGQNIDINPDFANYVPQLSFASLRRSLVS